MALLPDLMDAHVAADFGADPGVRSWFWQEWRDVVAFIGVLVGAHLATNFGVDPGIRSWFWQECRDKVAFRDEVRTQALGAINFFNGSYRLRLRASMKGRLFLGCSRRRPPRKKGLVQGGDGAAYSPSSRSWHPTS